LILVSAAESFAAVHLHVRDLLRHFVGKSWLVLRDDRRQFFSPGPSILLSSE
jgi:hypothetical protein